jgi:peptidoglycan/xylan/chitin deacetylase (PgdA/CDA1 family)
MTEPRRRPSRRPSNRRSRGGTAPLIAVVAFVAVAGAVGLALWSFRGATPAGTATSVGSRVATSTAASTRTASTPASASARPAPGPTSSPDPAVATSATERAYQASLSAAQHAAVRYPGAPALASDAKSIGGIGLHPKHKYVAITFDDGYNFQVPMLALLEKYQVRSTTFLIGSWVRDNMGIVRRLKADGWEIANHTWTHPNLKALSAGQITSELSRTQKVISSITGSQAPYFRPPGGATNPKVKAAAARLGLRVVLWNRTFGSSRGYFHVMQENGGVHPGDVILAHWGDKDAYNALKRILPELRAQGYEFVTVSELIADSGGL